jgi:hypothetical protein
MTIHAPVWRRKYKMSAKSLMFLTSALASAGMVIEPLAADAAGLSQLGTW